jgi:nucleotide-binding universal stress UspA family protein
MLKNIIVPLDGSTLAEAALPYAKSILAPGGKLTLLSVVQSPEAPLYDFYPAPMPRVRSFEDELNDAVRYAQDYLERIAGDLREQTDCAVITRTEAGDPALEIVAVAEEAKADAIVMSTHGRSGLSRWIFGSVTQKVLGAAPCPIFVVPGAMSAKADEPAAAASASS